MTNDCEQQLRDQCRAIAYKLQFPPMVDEGGEELPAGAIECHGNPHDIVWVADYDHHFTAEQLESECDSLSYDAEEDLWQCAETGKVWVGDAIGYWTTLEDGLVLGGDETTDAREMSGFDFVNDALDVEYRAGNDRAYRSAEILVAYGGPNIWVDTKRNVVCGAWASDRCTVGYADAVGLDEACEELYNC